ncbi:MAG: hypothetical protein JOY90_29260 [Bradyrhizobium sp.]|uniref:hypothetical protein n=1 Tax=Bradyrhizobium sp. TaxID=376 RepID=UPI001DA7585F|nr:hypothetical protein [Bradyrhizobium sp.]MBV9564499.1 hypothetical protein [Bradyrhizobium sp.]
MRLSHLAAAFAVAATAAAPMARAFPIGPSPAPSSNPVIEVRGLCGLGWHRELDGACYRNGVPYGYYGYPYGPSAAYEAPYYAGRCWLTPTAFGPRRVCAW